jgi:hypothetical protein
MTARTPVHQLRIYEIFEASKAAFHARFRDHAARIMRREGDGDPGPRSDKVQAGRRPRWQAASPTVAPR